jgi:hypothetical protein
VVRSIDLFSDSTGAGGLRELKIDEDNSKRGKKRHKYVQRPTRKSASLAAPFAIKRAAENARVVTQNSKLKTQNSKLKTSSFAYIAPNQAPKGGRKILSSLSTAANP